MKQLSLVVALSLLAAAARPANKGESLVAEDFAGVEGVTS